MRADLPQSERVSRFLTARQHN